MADVLNFCYAVTARCIVVKRAAAYRAQKSAEAAYAAKRKVRAVSDRDRVNRMGINIVESGNRCQHWIVLKVNVPANRSQVGEAGH